MDRDRLIKAVEGSWICEKIEQEVGGKIRVYWRSCADPDTAWSYQQDLSQETPSVGTQGKISFIWKKEQP